MSLSMVDAMSPLNCRSMTAAKGAGRYSLMKRKQVARTKILEDDAVLESGVEHIIHGTRTESVQERG